MPESLLLCAADRLEPQGNQTTHRKEFPVKLKRAFLVLCCFGFLVSVTGAGLRTRLAGPVVPDPGAAAQDKLVYADFETVKDNRPVSNGGGFIQLTSYQENATMPCKLKGQAGVSPLAPELVHLKQGDPNRAMAFDYQLVSGNQYAGVGVEIHAKADNDGKQVAIDVSKYKFLTFQMYASGAQVGRVEFVSRDNGITISRDFPSEAFKINPAGFNTYQVPLANIAQPNWDNVVHVNPKDVLKKLTSITISITCGPCLPASGTVVIDNVIFQN
jgi:hypothetical protein